MVNKKLRWPRLGWKLQSVARLREANARNVQPNQDQDSGPRREQKTLQHAGRVSIVINAGKTAAKRVLRKVLAPSLAYLLFLLFYLLRPFKRITILRLNEHRIGEYAGATDLYLRRLKLGIVKRPEGWSFGLINDPANDQLTRMFARAFPIIKNRLLYEAVINTQLRRSRFVERLPFVESGDVFRPFNEIGPVVRFSADEEEQGRKLLERMGVPDNQWFVCFHARDSAYLQQRIIGKDMSFTNSRNSSIENQLNAMKYVTSQGGYAVRVGAVVSEPLSESDDEHIIDYASNYRSDFGDIYLVAKCKFMVCGGGGLAQLAHTFNVPVLNIKLLAMGAHVPFGIKDLMLPSPLRELQSGRLLSYAEIFESTAANYLQSNDLSSAGLEALDNSSEDIVDATKEMNERIDGRFVEAPEDDDLHKRFKSLLEPRHFAYDMPGRVGAVYLRRHKELLETPAVLPQ